MQLRDHEGVKGKRDAYPFDPRLLKIMDGYNVRNLDTPEARVKLDELKESIRANGVKVPLEVKFDGEDVYVLAGHRRHKATMELIAEGEPIETVLIIAEQKKTSDAERTLNLVVSNSGEPLKPLEVAEVVRRLTAFGWDKGQIAKRMGWKSANTVTQHLDMLALPAEVQKHVRDGDISATLARNIAKGVDAKTAEDMIKANLEENRKIRGKRVKVTAKTLQRDAKPKTDKLPLPARQPRGVEREPPPPQPETVAEPPAQSEPPAAERPTLVETIRAAATESTDADCDARLRYAAPDMLAALIGCVEVADNLASADFSEYRSAFLEATDRARAAIVKAGVAS